MVAILEASEMDECPKYEYIRGRQLYSTYEVMMQNIASDRVLFDSITVLPPTGLYKKYFFYK